jgi:hypothetical protein
MLSGYEAGQQESSLAQPLHKPAHEQRSRHPRSTSPTASNHDTPLGRQECRFQLKSGHGQQMFQASTPSGHRREAPKSGRHSQGGTTMNPTMSPQSNGVANLSRNVLCTHYSRCLDVAIDKGWQGFSCCQCEAYAPEPPDETLHWKEQAGRCKLLLTHLFAPRSSRRRPRVAMSRKRLDFPMSERDLLQHTTDPNRQVCSDAGTTRLPEAFLAHLMLLVENRPHE